MIIELSASEWKRFAEDAHKAMFSELRSKDTDRIDFALVYGDGKTPMAYTIWKEMDKDTLYLQYGGTFPDFRGQGLSQDMFNQFLDAAFAKDNKRIYFSVENINLPMLRLALSSGFLIHGVCNRRGHTMVEFGKEKE